MKHMIYLMLTVFFISGNAFGSSDLVSIELKNNSINEQLRKKQLEMMLVKYDLSKWFFTSQILIDEHAPRPYSHPILTLNTVGLQRDKDLLSSFLHEQIHWYEEENSEKVQAAIKELREQYPAIPMSPPDGARNEYSTYLHLIVCYLEYDALIQVVGPESARDIISTRGKYFYKWIYKTVLSDSQFLKKVIDSYGLSIR